jgi:hypothetical protein
MRYKSTSCLCNIVIVRSKYKCMNAGGHAFKYNETNNRHSTTATPLTVVSARWSRYYNTYVFVLKKEILKSKQMDR